MPKMHGLLEGSAVWLVVQPPALQALEHAVLGLVDGGPATAQRTLDALAPVVPPAALNNSGIDEGDQLPAQPASVRLSLAEAMFLVHALQHLVVYRRTATGPAAPLSPEVCLCD